MSVKALLCLVLAMTAVVVPAMVPAMVPAVAPADSGEVVRVHDVPRTELNALRRLGDLWSLDWRDGAVIMLVSPAGRLALENAGYRVETDHTRHAERLAFLALDREDWKARGLAGIPGYSCYRTVEETHAQLAALATAYPDLARWESIGQSLEATQDGLAGDDIHVLVLANQNAVHPQAPLLVMGAQHSRELVTAEFAARFAEHLVHGYSTDPEARWLLDHREIHIVAQQNPDGRRRVETGQTSWRKQDGNPGQAFFWFLAAGASAPRYGGSARASRVGARPDSTLAGSARLLIASLGIESSEQSSIQRDS